jgi:hypothetical protein
VGLDAFRGVLSVFSYSCRNFALKKFSDLSMGSTASSDYKVRSTSQVDVSEKFLKQSVFDGNNNVVADGGGLSVPPVITLDKPVSGHSRGERSSSQSGAVKKRVAYSWPKTLEMPLVEEHFWILRNRTRRR